MGAVLRHRGPDGEGFLEDPAHGFSMGMRRLAIIDLEGGWQPLYNEDRSLALCLNGEIYNYRELREELLGRGHVFSTQSDAETVLHAFEEWGQDCLERLNGMFAFALHNLREGTTFFARDRCGQKPFYYHVRGGILIFASEIKAILESARAPRACNLPAVDPYLALRYVPEPQTLFEGIDTLPAAHCAEWKPGGPFKIRRYWDVALHSGTYLPDEELLERTGHLLRDAVSLTLRSDVPVGAYLSAGVDSSLLVALVAAHAGNVRTYSIGFGSPVDETRPAAETARLLGTRHTEVQCTPADFDLLPTVVRQMDRPVGDALVIAFHKLAEAAARDVKVVISGEGADEIYGGYSFQNVMLLAEAYTRWMPAFLHKGLALPALRALPVDFLNRFFVFPARLGSEGKARLVDFFGGYRARSLFGNVLALRTLWPLADRAALYTDAFRHLATEAWIPPVRDDGGPFLDRLLKLQWDEWIQDWCVIRQDKNAMAHALEVRLPFLDHRLIELAFQTPPRLKNNGFRDKIIERRLAARLLPPAITRRRKIPFYLPVEFFRDEPRVRALIAETLNDAQVRRRGLFKPERVRDLLARFDQGEFLRVKQVMVLVILELWHREFMDR